MLCICLKICNTLTFHSCPYCLILTDFRRVCDTCLYRIRRSAIEFSNSNWWKDPIAKLRCVTDMLLFIDWAFFDILYPLQYIWARCRAIGTAVCKRACCSVAYRNISISLWPELSFEWDDIPTVYYSSDSSQNSNHSFDLNSSFDFFTGISGLQARLLFRSLSQCFNIALA